VLERRFVAWDDELGPAVEGWKCSRGEYAREGYTRGTSLCGSNVCEERWAEGATVQSRKLLMSGSVGTGTGCSIDIDGGSPYWSMGVGEGAREEIARGEGTMGTCC
jgi:hypothetical protein